MLDSIERHVETFDLDFDPPWQRGHVWTDDQRGNFIGHLLTGGMVPHIIVREPTFGALGKYQVVDGKQRLTSVLRWKENLFPALIDGYDPLWYRDTDHHWSVQNIRADYVRVALESELLTLYLRLNSGGTPHTREQLERVRVMRDEAPARETALVWSVKGRVCSRQPCPLRHLHDHQR